MSLFGLDPLTIQRLAMTAGNAPIDLMAPTVSSPLTTINDAAPAFGLFPGGDFSVPDVMPKRALEEEAIDYGRGLLAPEVPQQGLQPAGAAMSPMTLRLMETYGLLRR